MKKSQKNAKLSKAALPLVALFGGNACASSRNPLSLQSSIKKSAKSVVYQQNSRNPEIPALNALTKQDKHHTPFAAFTKKQTTSEAAIDRHNSKTLAILKDQGLLQKSATIQSSLSGNMLSRKKFSDDWIANTRLTSMGGNTMSTCVGGASYGGANLASFNANRQGPTSIFCSLYSTMTSTVTSAFVTMTSTNQGGRCRDFHMACDGQPLPVELMNFKVE